MKVFVDPACNILYSSFYLWGLRETFGRHNLCFSSIPFRRLHYTKDTHIFAFVVNDKRYCIDFADSNSIFYDAFLEWADVYGKVNFNATELPIDYARKIVRCGCNFAMCAVSHNKYVSVLYGLLNYLKARGRINYSYKIFLGRYIQQSKRANPMFTDTFDSNYIFFVSTLWHGQDKCNQARVNFIRACKILEKRGLLHFEGGLISDGQASILGIEDVLLSRRISHNEYTHKMRRSMLAFNTPAYFDCHGWKLPEYFAMGKVVISTPFVNELPMSLTHKKNIFFIEDSNVETICEAIHILMTNVSLYHSIAIGVAEYYRTWMSPKASMALFTNNQD